ncbi:MAG: fatty acid desaturase [Polyangiaceae bacterium]
MLRYAADRRTLAFIATYWLLVIAQWTLAPKNLAIAVPLVVLTCVLSWLCAVITHNSLHSPVFKKRIHNRIFQVVLTLSYGFPVSEYVPGHNLSHHKYTQERRDVMRTTKVRFGWNLLNAIAFFPRVGFDVTGANFRYAKVMKAKYPDWYRQFLVEATATWAVKGILLFVDWRKCLLYVVLPHLFAVWGITSVNYVQHDGCDKDHPYNHSRNFVGRIFNWITFNNGFHGIHHDEPGLHWSLTAKAHYERIHGHIDPALEQKSLFVYLVKTFLFPGKRLRYDGKPVVLPPEGPDDDWIPKGDAITAPDKLGETVAA